MEISEPRPEFTTRAQAITELEELVRAISFPLDQPCPNCNRPEQAGDPGRCHWQCPAVPQALSSDPASHPIEPHVTEIVFEMSRLGVFQPCWSCEGHTDSEDRIYRLPQINFYCARPIFALLLHEHTDLLHSGGHLHCPWQIVLHSLGMKMTVTYALEPCPKDEQPRLGELHEDLDRIGHNLAQRLLLIAEARLASLRMEQATRSAFYGQRL